MPTDSRSQGQRVSTGYLDTVNDDYPGGGSSAPGFAPGQAGAKVTIGRDNAPIALSTNRYEGTYQYVRSLSTDTQAPILGCLAFWNDRDTYTVSTASSSTIVENLAGVYLGAYPNGGKYGFIKIFDGGGRTLVNFSGTVPTAGQIANAQTGSNIATSVAAGTDIKGYSFGVLQGGKTVGDCAVVALRGLTSES